MIRILRPPPFPQAWKFHRSSLRYITCLLDAPTSKLLQALYLPLATILAATFAVGFSRLALDSVPPEVLRSALDALLPPQLLPHVLGPDGKLAHIVIPSLPYSLASGALSLLLVFRTNASYGRWWEGRGAWRVVLSETRDIGRRAAVWVKEPRLRARIVRHAAAFSRALTLHIRPTSLPRADQHAEASAELRAPEEALGRGAVAEPEAALLQSLTGAEGLLLTPAELKALVAASHRPQHVLSMLTLLVDRAQLSPPLQASFDTSLASLQNAAGICEKIVTTPIPVVYGKLCKRFLMVRAGGRS